ncbi:MAG TPA: glycine--tRNA ligase subunit beta, partial [Planctomycetota bacterium]|nr:glycine--tRNA ligase subunit beta [Planctomycetota bacterium]
MPDLLFELGCEELPALYVPPALEHMKKDATERLKALGLAPKSVLATATPRRLTLFVEELPVAQAARQEEVLGPPEKAAYKNGDPTPAARGFAEKNGVKVEELVVKDTPKGRYLFAVKKVEGKHTSALLAEMLPAFVRAIPFPKTMRWPQAPGFPFPRPIRRVLALFGREVVPVEIAGQKAGRVTVGHPFLTGGRELAVERADYAGYRTLLKTHGVIVDRNERRALIEQALEAVFEAHKAPMKQHALLEEVTDLVEDPSVMVGKFDEKYLKLPREVVEAAMTDHQRYFPIVTAEGKIEPRFAFVANRPKLTQELITEGNERVLRARLEDASFYLHEDLKRTLAERVETLKGIVFQEKLGTMLQKTERLEKLADHIAEVLQYAPADREAAKRAARLAKADLTTELVKEFPELQGGIGAKYAALQGEKPEVAEAIREQYLPRFAGDELPKTRAGIALSLAEKLDNIAGFFSLGLTPTGSTDPYALRRQAAGVVRIFLERQIPEGEARFVAFACAPFAPKDTAPPEYRGAFAIMMFLADRAKQAFADAGYRYDVIDAVLGTVLNGGDASLVDQKRRLDVVTALAKDPSFPDLVELVERTFNISKALKGEP